MYLIHVSRQLLLLVLMVSSPLPSTSKPISNPKPKIVLQESSIELMINLNVTSLPHSIDNLIDKARIICSKETLDLMFSRETWEEFDKICSKIKSNTISKAERFRKRISDKYIDLHGRNKKSLDILGTLWGNLAGNPTPADKARYEKNFALIKEQQANQENFDEKVLESEQIMSKIIEDHNKRLKNITNETAELMDEIKKTKSNELCLVNLMAMVSSLNEWYDHLLETEKRADEALKSGLVGRLSPLLLSPAELASTIVEIQSTERILEPIYGKDEIHNFYDFPFVKVHQSEGFLHFILTIPLIDTRIDLALQQIDKDTKAKAKYELTEFEYIAISTVEKDFYILLTENELRDCIETVNRMILCTHRKARLVRSGGTVGSLIVHDIDETRFISKSVLSNATLRCNDTTETILLPNDSVITVPLECSLSSPGHFFIPKHHSRKIEIKWDKFEIDEVDFQKLSVFDKEPKPNVNVHESDDFNSQRMVALEKNHNELGDEFDGIKEKHEQITIGASSHGGISLIMFCFMIGTLMIIHRQSKIIAQTTTNVHNQCGWLTFHRTTPTLDPNPNTPRLPHKTITQTNL